MQLHAAQKLLWGYPWTAGECLARPHSLTELACSGFNSACSLHAPQVSFVHKSA